MYMNLLMQKARFGKVKYDYTCIRIRFDSVSRLACMASFQECVSMPTLGYSMNGILEFFKMNPIDLVLSFTKYFAYRVCQDWT